MVVETLQESDSEDTRKGGSDESWECAGRPFILSSVSFQALGAGCVAILLTDYLGLNS